jgi:hypothetical protein
MGWKESDWVKNWAEDIGSLYRHKMEKEQMFESLKAEMKAAIRTNQIKTDVNLK